MVAFNQADLDFILQQIKIAEQNAATFQNGAIVAGIPLTELIPNPLLPWGLRTVDGTFNNLIAGRTDWGSADQLFPRLLDPSFDPAEAGTSYAQTGGVVIDSQPRTISNLVVDQTLNNPAAIYAALKYAGIVDAEADAIVDQVLLLHNLIVDGAAGLQPLIDAVANAQAIVAPLLLAQATAQTNLTNAQGVAAAYTTASTEAAQATAAAGTAINSASALFLQLNLNGSTLDAADAAALLAAQSASDDLVTQTTELESALSVPGITAGDLAAATAAKNAALALSTAVASLTALLADNDASATDIAAALNALTTAASAVTAVSTASSAVSASLTAANNAVTAAQSALQSANDALVIPQANLTQAQTNLATAQAQLGTAQQDLDALLADAGVEIDNGTLVIPNVAPDEGISAPFNSWMTLFGQFFDHGLDLVTKGGNGIVFVPLQPDDPLFVAPTPENPNPPNFMIVTRATQTVDANGVIQHTNTTTPFVDQNQTYTSHASHQAFLREYVTGAGGTPVATGKLLEGDNGGLATWADIKAQSADMLGIVLEDANINNVPLLATDEYGRVLRGDNGFALVPVAVTLTDATVVQAFAIGNASGLDLTNITAADLVGPLNGSLDVVGVAAFGTGHAFLDDIAHAANPYGDHDGNPGTPNQLLNPDGDADTGGSLDPTALGEYDDELLDRHFITGDGRGNENIGLTAVHHVFHSEHNRLADHTKDVVLSTGNIAFINEWLLTDITEIPADLSTLNWDGERLFQAARFGTEMQYQHLVFEEFARKVNPMVDLFVFNPTMDVNPAIFAEFAHVVYRFGHSMLTETVDRLDANGQTTDDIGLIQAFLNPVAFDENAGVSADVAAGAIIRGMTRQQGNEIDEFVTEALRNNLVGLPLDLATINMTRAREAGIPSLNEARAQFYEMTKSEWLKPYTSWVDFSQNLKNPASIINLVAAYGQHGAILAATTLEDKRKAAMAIIFGDAAADDTDANANTVLINGTQWNISDRTSFLNSSGTWATQETGLNNVDFWLGGLAEAILPFGGMLGSTFTFVFEMQMENLQNGDRLYYLSRTQGLHFLQELENNAFSKIIMANTDLGEEGATHLPGEIFARVDHILEVDTDVQNTPDPVHGNKVLQALEPKVARDLHLTVDGNTYDHSLKFTGGEHVVLGGSELNDVLIADLGDDTIWGDGGDDYIVGGHGINRLHGGTGSDIIYGGGDPEFIHGDEGDDVIHGGNGLGDLIFAGSGSDFVIGGVDGKEVFGAEGNDFILGSPDVDFLLGGEGDDWIEGGEGFDTIAGENSELFFNSPIIGHDVMFAGTNEQDFDAESGDDIMVQGESVMRNEGMLGFDWVSFKGLAFGADADLRVKIFTNVAADILRNRFDRVEAMSGWDHNDHLIGDDRLTPAGPFNPNLPVNEQTLEGDGLDLAGMNRIAGLQQVLGIDDADLAGLLPTSLVFNTGNILLGGGGSDVLEGRGGDDVLDGDAWLNVRIAIHDANGVEIGTTDKMQGIVEIYDEHMALHGALDGQQLDTLMFTRDVRAEQLGIVREILEAPGGIDIAMFTGNRDEYIIERLDIDTVRVTHLVDDGTGVLVPGGVDGTDLLNNIERLGFADGFTTGDGGPILDPVGSAPTAITFSPAAPQVPENVAGAVVATFNIVDPDAGDFHRILISDPLAPDGPRFIVSGNQIVLDPGASLNFEAEPTITIQVTAIDSENLSITVPLTITVLDQVEANVAPILDNGGPIFFFTDEDVPIDGEADGISLLPGGTDPDGPLPFTFELVDEAGAAALGVAVNHETGALDFVPVANFNGVVNFQYRLFDGLDFSPVVDVEINVLPVNDVPTGAATAILADGSTNTDYTVSEADLLAGFADIDGPLPLSVINLVADNGSVTDDGGAPGSRIFTITPNTNFFGTMTLAYDVTDGEIDGILAATNTYLVTTNNVPPIIVPPVTSTVNEAAAPGTVIGTLGFFDPDSPPPTFTLIDSAEGRFALVGDQIVVANGALLDFERQTTHTIVVQVTDEFGRSSSAEIALTVADVNDAVPPGLAGAQTLNGNNADNILSGGAGNDTLNGNGGNDILDGGTGTDAMNGGAGNDTFFVNVAADTTVEAAGGGNDTIVTGLATFTLRANVENLVLTNTGGARGIGNANDSTIRGNIGADRLEGRGGNDLLIGEEGADQLDGGGGNDQLYGGAGADQLTAGAGNDWLDGGADNDVYRGNGGNDTLVFRGDHGDDQVIGFGDVAGNEDVLLLDASLFASFTAVQAAMAQVGNDVVITTGAASTVTLTNVNLANLDQTDFRFG